MEYFFWALGIVLLVFIIKKYRGAKAKHQASANAVFAKYTFEKLSEDDQARVEKKARQLAPSINGELEQYAWYAFAMKDLKIPSAIPDNPNWYAVKTPDQLPPSEPMTKAVVAFINRNYSLDIEIAGISDLKASKEIRDAVAELDHLDKPEQKA